MRTPFLLIGASLLFCGCSSDTNVKTQETALRLIGEPMPLEVANVTASSLAAQGISARKVFFSGAKSETPTFYLAVASSDAVPAEQFVSHDSTLSKAKELPSIRGCPNKKWGVYLFGDFLYWRAQEDNLIFALRDVPIIQAAGVTPGKVLLAEPKFKYTPGWRAGAGFNLPYGGWDICTSWTSIESHAEDAVTEPNFGIGALLVPSFGDTNNTDASFSRGKWSLQFNALDVDLGRGSLLSRRFSLRPIAGAKLAWIHQHLNVHYEGFLPGSTKPDEINDIKAFARFMGAGPKVGTAARWKLGDWFGLYGDFATALLYGEVHSKTNITATPGSSTIRTIPVLHERHVLRPMVELRGGIDFGHCFGRLCSIYLGAGYEAQFWWDQNEMILGFFRNTDGDLQFQGATGRLRLEF